MLWQDLRRREIRLRREERGQRREERKGGNKEDEERGLSQLRGRHTVPHFIYQVLEYEEYQTQRKWQSP